MLFEDKTYVISGYKHKNLDFYPKQHYENASLALDIICTNGEKIRLSVYGDCCSCGWLEFDDLDACIGKTIVKIEEGFEVDLIFSGLQEYDVNTNIIIEFSDGDCFTMVHRNSSNGYYSNVFDIRIINS